MKNCTRRDVLRAAAGLPVAGVAGCLGTSPGTDTAGRYAAASFFVIGDFAANVTGDELAVDTLVPTGQHGHGWEPSPEVVRSVAHAAAFIYVGPGFQPWADDLIESLVVDRPDLPVIAARHGVDLLPPPEEDAGHDEGTHADEPTSHGDGAHADEQPSHSDDTHADDHESDAHSHGPHDPHFWLDPTRASTAVETLADGLRAVSGADADTLTANAESYTAELASLDDAFADELANRTRNDVLIAGHNAFQYLGDRYDFRVNALTGIAPDATPSPQDITRAREVIAEHDISHVLTPVLESDRAARILVSETDAEATLPVTALPGYSSEWAARDWGYLEIMRDVNLPSFRTALGASE